MPVRTQPAWRLRQYRQQRRLGLRQKRGRLAQVGPARRLHAFDGAAVRRALQVQLQDLPLAQVRFQLQRTQRLLRLAPRRTRTDLGRHQDARHLHGQGGTTGDDVARKHPLLGRTQQRPGIDPGVQPEPAVLVVQQRLQVQRRDAVRRGRITPDAVAVGEGTQRGAVCGHHQGRGVARLRQRQRERQVQQQQGRQQRHRAPAQPRQQARPAPGAPRDVRGGGVVQWHACSRWKRPFCLLRWRRGERDIPCPFGIADDGCPTAPGHQQHCAPSATTPAAIAASPRCLARPYGPPGSGCRPALPGSAATAPGRCPNRRAWW
ncbi:hypothetical protein NB705_003872 [Xanthomonas sacchari]|nr:hypothetical protein [Xanthomonas sacchari]